MAEDKDKSVTKIQRTFSFYGLSITKQLCASIHKFLQKIDPDERESWLTRVIKDIFKQNPGTPQVSLEALQRSITECHKPESSLQETETVFNVINAFDIPKVAWDNDKKKFVLQKVVPELYANAVEKSSIFRDRLGLLWHRTRRQELFTPLRFGEDFSERWELTPIEYLMSELKTGNVFVLGLLSQLTEGQFYLEDTGGSVKIDLKKASFQAGLVTEGSIVIANGNFEDGVLNVKDIGFPPAEPSKNTRALFGNENTFGGAHPTTLKISEKLRAREEARSEAMIIFVSEFWVDDNRVLDKFETMLKGFSEFPPVAFVLCGHFLSFPPNITSAQKLKEGFSKVAEIIQKYQDIKESSQFVLVPGPYDLGSPKILPRGPLPKSILEDLTRKIPNTILATNPCRIQYCTKEIVVFREDMLMKLCRNTLKFPDEGEIYEHYAKSIICQSHLSPLCLPVTPVYWKYDHTLQLFPTPDLIVVADKFQPYTTSYEDCQVVNPGTFVTNDFSFKVYVPSTNIIEDSAIPNEPL
ncbi:DNA polymerase epsilon subunit 2 [Venturia canescens]|uniref:DNA polymerase epsilon subunit 2 n=1 Tax=Venturia canescens TaxID=32260 RepID=UPI001C9C95F7|nr:DNA polymerase epsilon subunit 2 [Venturia canescens]